MNNCGDVSALAAQCMRFCQDLATKDRFEFSLKIGDSFCFLLDNRKTAMRKSQAMKPRKYPSAMKRDEERQRKFLETRETASWAEVARQKKESASAEVVKGSSA